MCAEAALQRAHEPQPVRPPTHRAVPPKGVHGDLHLSKECAGWTWHPRIHERCSVHVQSVVVTFLHLTERLRCHQPGRQLRARAGAAPVPPDVPPFQTTFSVS